jgi:hypothetical protein
MMVIDALYTSDLELRRWRKIKNLTRNIKKITACRNSCYEDVKDNNDPIEDKEEKSYVIREF